MNVTLRQLHVFRAVAEARSFSRAGDVMALTQPAVSRAIRELEEQLDLKLLDRTTREVLLTEAGQALASRVGRVLDELTQTLTDVRDLADARRGTVRVASSPTLSAGLMPACIAACATQEPDIRLVLLDRIQQDVLASVRAGEVDFGVVIEPHATDDLQAETILRDPFALVMPAGHALAKRRSVTWKSLSGLDLVLLDHASGSRRLIDQALAHHGAACRVVQELGHPTTALRMVEAGIGLSVLPALALPAGGRTREFGRLVARPLAPEVQREIVLVHRRNRTPSPVAMRVWGLVRQVVGAQKGRATT